jgi:capsid protein
MLHPKPKKNATLSRENSGIRVIQGERIPLLIPAMVRLFLLDQYDDAELDRKKTAAMFAGFITKTAPEDPMMGEGAADLDGAAIASLEPGTMQVLLPG